MDLEATLLRKNQELELLSMTDHLTGLYNQRFFYIKIDEEIRRASQLSYPLALLFVDFDELKKVNDLFGQLAGDMVLANIARTITGSVKETDVVARLGGDEFCVIAPGARKENAMEIAERIRKRTEKVEFKSGGRSFSVTVSIGVSELGPSVNTARKLVGTADAAAKQAKRSGKNRVLHATDLGRT